MKRKVLCLFSFLLILLVFCTLVSPKAEEEMRTLVDARHAEGSKLKGNRNIAVGNIAITWEHSNDILFHIIEGDGWESGLRIAEIPPTYFTRHEEHVELGKGTDYWYIYNASREPVPGGAITAVEEFWKGEDNYLLWCPETIENLDKLSNSMTVLYRTENAALVSMRQATFPFFEHRVWYSLRGRMGDDLRVYSLHDVQQFFDALPWICGIATVLLCSLLLWGASWLLSDKMGRRKGLLWLNIFLIIGLLGTLPLLLSQFDLPASLMPKASILDVSHYAANLERILSSLDAMGNPVVRNALDQVTSASAAVLGFGVLVTATVIAIEVLVCRRSKKDNVQ